MQGYGENSLRMLTVCSSLFPSLTLKASLECIGNRVYLRTMNTPFKFIKSHQSYDGIEWCLLKWVLFEAKKNSTFFAPSRQTSSLCQITISVDSWKLIDVDGTTLIKNLLKCAVSHLLLRYFFVTHSTRFRLFMAPTWLLDGVRIVTEKLKRIFPNHSRKKLVQP